MLDLEKLKICFLAGTLGRGGAEQQLFYMLKALLASGAQPQVLCLTEHEHWQERIEALGVPVQWVGRRGSRAWRLGQIVATLRRNPPDILQSQHFYTNLYVAAAARLLGSREVGAMRNDGVSEVQAGGKVLGSLSLKTPRTLAANSRLAIKNARSFGVSAARLHLLPNVVDTNRFAVNGNSVDESIRIIAVGRLVEQKRMDRFLNVVAQLRAKSPVKVKATIVGGGPLRGQLERRAAELELFPGTIEFTGSVGDVAAYYRTADILVLTSDWEGTPNVVLEAMASGVPVVATKVGGVPDIIQHGRTGFLAGVEDENAIVNLLLLLSEDEALRRTIGACAREYVEANHSIDNLSKHLTNIYMDALQ